jgi:nanoRNase/pAp phosphatase (c-di-AMP/oligoRNAs hydrolase)
MNSNVLILRHGNCSDGAGAAYAAWKKFGDSAEYVEVHYGNPPPDVTGREVYILDFSYKREVLREMYNKAESLLVLDHHKTAQEDLADLDFAVFDMNRSGCVMAWEHFHPYSPTPLGLLLIQDRDLWRFVDPLTRPFGAALRAFVTSDFNDWDSNMCAYDARKLAKRGEDLLMVADQEVAALVKRAHPVNIYGFVGLACNAPTKHASDLGNALAKQSGTFGLVYSYDGNTKEWQYSLRSIGDYDVSVIAKQFGGGGHKNASGMSSKELIV